MSKQTFEDVLGRKDVRELWGTGYRALPVLPQDYAMGGVLPAVLYMIRWGYRRGKGRFQEEFGRGATVTSISSDLIANPSSRICFEASEGGEVLADLLLAFLFENKNHKKGRGEPVIRVYPTHYLTSWVDLPVDIANLRGVPEMVTTLLAARGNESGRPESSDHPGDRFTTNSLLKLFSPGTYLEGEHHNLRSDRFDENEYVGIDQLLGIRVAQILREAPEKSIRNPAIPGQLPLARAAANNFVQDLERLIGDYSAVIPRQTLLAMLESCLSVGMTCIFLSTPKALLDWEIKGTISETAISTPWPIFVDCSASVDEKLRRLAEESLDDVIGRIPRLSLSSMCLRILDQWAEHDRTQDLPASVPDPKARVEFLGSLIDGRHPESSSLRSDLRKLCNKLSDALSEGGEDANAPVLENESIHPAWRLSEAIISMMGERKHDGRYRGFFDSSLMLDQPNGLGRRRRTTVKGKSVERRSMVLTNTALDFLVHIHLGHSASSGARYLSLNDFLSILKARYGFYVDEAPPGVSVPDQQLRRNRAFLERRLRDLGLFVGVNDSEAMKRLKTRFEVSNAN